MAGTFGDFLESGVLNHVFGGITFTPPAFIFLALSKANPLDDCSGLSEPVAGPGYARCVIANNKTSWTTAVGNQLSNAIDFTFPEATGSWGLITHFALLTTSGIGNPSGLLGHADLTTSKQVDAGDIPKFSAGDLDIQLN